MNADELEFVVIEYSSHPPPGITRNPFFMASVKLRSKVETQAILIDLSVGKNGGMTPKPNVYRQNRWQLSAYVSMRGTKNYSEVPLVEGDAPLDFVRRMAEAYRALLYLTTKV